MEHNFLKSRIGRIWTVAAGAIWLSILVIVPLDLLESPRGNFWGIGIMFIGCMLLAWSRRKNFFDKKYLFKMGYQYLQNSDRNCYFAGYVLLYLGFIVLLTF